MKKVTNILSKAILLSSIGLSIYLVRINQLTEKTYQQQLTTQVRESCNKQKMIDALKVSVSEAEEKSKASEELLETLPINTPLDTLIIVSQFGWRHSPIDCDLKFHGGNDYDGEIGDTIYATGNGIVDFAGELGGYGNTVTINHMPGIKTLYAHMNRILINENTFVHVGDPIGLVGKSGKVTGSHLHYEIWMNGIRVDPSKMIIEY